MKKYLLLILIFFLMVSVFLCGCFVSEEKTASESLVGTWKDEDSNFRMFQFFEDGTCLITSGELEGTYYINDEDQLVVNQTYNSVTYVYEYSLNINSDKLVLTDVENFDVHVFRKQ